MIRSTLRAAFRQLQQDAGYAIAFILTLGLGIGASTAIFSAVEGVLIRPLPYPHADRIVYMQQPLSAHRRREHVVLVRRGRRLPHAGRDARGSRRIRRLAVQRRRPRRAARGLRRARHVELLQGARDPSVPRPRAPGGRRRPQRETGGGADVRVLAARDRRRSRDRRQDDRADGRAGDDRRRAGAGIALRRHAARGALRELSDQRALHGRVDAERARAPDDGPLRARQGRRHARPCAVGSHGRSPAGCTTRTRRTTRPRAASARRSRRGAKSSCATRGPRC